MPAAPGESWNTVSSHPFALAGADAQPLGGRTSADQGVPREGARSGSGDPSARGGADGAGVRVSRGVADVCAARAAVCAGAAGVLATLRRDGRSALGSVSSAGKGNLLGAYLCKMQIGLALAALAAAATPVLGGCEDCPEGEVTAAFATFLLSCRDSDLTSVVATGPCSPFDASPSSYLSAVSQGVVAVGGSSPGVCHITLTFGTGSPTPPT